LGAALHGPRDIRDACRQAVMSYHQESDLRAAQHLPPVRVAL
jgi:hypothetical protein